MKNKKILLTLAAAAALGLFACNTTTTSSSAASSSSSESSAASSSEASSSSSETATSSSSSVAAVQTISDITTVGTYSVKGVVVAITTKGFVIHDGTAGILVFQNAAPSVSIGDYVKVSQTLDDTNLYNGFYQFTAGATVSQLVKTNAPAIPAAVDLTKTVVDSWTGASFAPTAIQKYKWTTTCGLSGTYTTLPFTGSTVAIENTYTPTALAVTAGKKYAVEAYFYGYATKYSYASVALTSVTPVFDDVASIAVTAANNAKSVHVAETVQLSAAVSPTSAHQEVTWSSSDTASATISSTGLVTGVAAAESVVFTATSTADATKTGTITLAILPVNTNPVTSVTLDAQSYSLPIGVAHTFTATVAPAEANQNVTWASDNADVATVANGVVTPLSVGTANITVTTVGLDSGDKALTATIALTVTAEPGVKETTIADLLTWVNSQDKSLDVKQHETYYSVSGILETKSATDAYGNGYLTDAATGATIKIFGSTTTASAFSFASGAIKFTNPKDATTTLTGYTNGSLVTMKVQAEAYKGTAEIMGIMTAHEASTATYSASINTPENGTASLSKTTGIAYGEAITVTVQPAAGYEVASVKATNAQGGAISATVDSNDATKYNFNASCVNAVVVVFSKAVVPTGVISYDLASNGTSFAKADGTAISTTYADYLATINSVGFEVTNGNLSQCTNGTTWASKYIVVAATCASGSTDVVASYLSVSSKYAFSGAKFTLQNWNTDTTTVSIEYSTDGSTWTADATSPVSSTTGTALFDLSSSSTFSAKLVRIKVTTVVASAPSSAKKYRVGVSAVSLTYPNE